jgi:hypothetical protein
MKRLLVEDIELFLDALTDPLSNSKEIEDWLGVVIPESTIKGLGLTPEFDTECEGDILAFLHWLLEQRAIQGATT